jgi:threonyl-tRNA synthetase
VIQKPIPNKDYLVLLPNNNLILPENYSGNSKDFQALLNREVFHKPVQIGEAPPHLKIMKQLELVDHEDLSDHGHLRFYPKGALIIDLLSDYLLEAVLEEGAYPVKNSCMYNISAESIRRHVELFGDRVYLLKSDNREFVLRYAACFGQFSILKNALISYRHLPLKLFELADSYRLEQSGEVSGLFRQRRFHMGDLHVLCRDLQSAKQEFLKLYKKAHQMAHEFGWDYVAMVNMCRSFYEKNKDFISDLMQAHPKPMLLYLGIPNDKYYWVINIDLDYIDNLRRPVESVGMQIDIGNAERFGIQFVDENGKKKHPVIIHAALMGSLERWLNNILENAAKQQKHGKLSSLPLWLSPVQIRILTIADRHIPKASEIANRLKDSKVRLDIDDRPISLQRKIRDARKEWIPVHAVIGDREAQSDTLSVSVRGDKEYQNKRISLEELIQSIQSRCHNKPFRKSYVSMMLSKRPKFA